MEYYRNCITSTNWAEAIKEDDQSEPGYNLIRVLISNGFTMTKYGQTAGFSKFCDKTTNDFLHLKGEILLTPESNRLWYTFYWGNFTKQGYYYNEYTTYNNAYSNYYITPPSKRPNVDFIFFPLKNGGYFFHLSATSVFDPFPQIKIKNTQPNTDLTWAEKEGNTNYGAGSVQRLNYTLIGIPTVTDSIIDRPCLMFFANNLAKDNTITFINNIDYNKWPNKSGEDPITYLDDTMEHFDYQPNICTLVKYPLEDGYIGNLYLMATSPVNKVTEDGMFFSIGNRNFFNIYGNLVVELPADKEDYQWQLR